MIHKLVLLHMFLTSSFGSVHLILSFQSDFSPMRNEEWIWWCLSFRYLQACEYHVHPSVETGCFPWTFARSEINLSAMSMFLSFDIDSTRIFLFSGSIATNPEPDIFWTNFKQCFINYVFWYLFAFWWYLYGMILLYPIPYCYMVSFDAIRQSMSRSSMISLKNTNTYHTIRILEAFYF